LGQGHRAPPGELAVLLRELRDGSPMTRGYSKILATPLHGTPSFQFHLNVAGMAVCRDVMRRSGMTYRAEHHPFPAWPFKDVEDWRSADQARRDAYVAAERAASAQTVPGQVGIPEFKLLSNGPWLVGSQEIAQALDRYEEAPASVRAEPEADELWRDWLGWLRETMVRGGFTVS
ncbi:hypothetical protein KV557_39755, partial [Kitasatospora aureofaciens]|uniref:hypothetical protein n=1 Tax=Kitasatospora aureofaciens TaxID=1894 RepID=UPI001C48ADE2